MPMARVSRSEPLTKDEFHRRLQECVDGTDEALVGDPVIDQRTAWIWVKDGALLTKLHADTTREAVQIYLGLLRRSDHRLQWTVAMTQRGNPSKIAVGADHQIIKGFYLYLADALVGQLPLGSTGAGSA